MAAATTRNADIVGAGVQVFGDSYGWAEPEALDLSAQRVRELVGQRGSFS
jgi:hypothetical protein